MALTEKLAREMAGNEIFLRGKEYYRAGMVRSLAWDGKFARADVLGSRPRPYKVTISFSQGMPRIHCTCAHYLSDLCKHGVAVILYLIDHGETGISEDDADPDDAEADQCRVDSSLKDFLVSVQDTPRIQMSFSFRNPHVDQRKGIPFGLFIVYQGLTRKITDITSLLAPYRSKAGDVFPPVAAFSHGQVYFLNMMLGFTREPVAGGLAVRRLTSAQLSAVLDHVSQSADIDIVEASGFSKFMFVKDPFISLSVNIRTLSRNRIIVTAVLNDPLNPDCRGGVGSILVGSRLWLLDSNRMSFRLLHPGIDRRFLTHFLNVERELEGEERQYFLVGILPKLKEFAAVTIDDTKANELRVETVPPKPQYKVHVDRGALTIGLAFGYGSEQLDYAGRNDAAYFERIVGEEHVLFRRDIAREEAIIHAFIRQSNGVFDRNSGLFLISASNDIFDFLSTHVSKLESEGKVLFSEKARALFSEGEQIQPVVRVSGSGIDWFAYDISFSRGGEIIDIPDKVIREHLDSGREFIRLKTGEFVKLDVQAFDRVAGLIDDKEHKGKLLLAHIPFMMDELKAAGINLEADVQTQKLYEELKGFKGIDPVPLPALLNEVLRDYQHYGVSWMSFLQKFRFGGILADEMGLGKTLQALTMIQRDIESGCSLPSLVVCPTTLVWNWEAEVRKFLPGLNPLVISGQDRRARINGITGSSVVITSYALLRRDIEQYHAHQFHYLILDEAQNIKNRHTISARVTKQLNASYRLALTGTPLENSIADIWSIFDFLMPSFLGNYERFRAAYEIPITQEQDHQKLELLSKRIAPFVLRRIKRDVIKELPEKIEQTSFCELEPAQAKIYSAMADKARAQAVDAYRSKGFDRSRMLILTLILRLRQICCHPELAGVKLKHRIGVSAKTDLLKEMLQEMVSAGRRVLIFSQFVEMLGIIREHLTHEKIPFEYMDGRTKDRRAPVDRFNSDSSVKVFLLSLKVGGLGLNLTSADTVILYEPWWNPAVEQQAIDRAHRIGQNKSVLAYHLIARGTIEEKILELQSRKKFLMNALVLSENSMSKKLGWEDIKFLLDLKDAP